MRKDRWIAALLAVWLGGNAWSVSAAKPPDLPANNEVVCQNTEPGRLRLQRDASGLVRVEVEPATASDDGDRPVCLDAWCPQALPLLVQCLWRDILAAMHPSPADAPPARDAINDDAARSRVDPMFAATAEKARLLYELASRCAREGKLAEARDHLREAHLANPTCRFGRLAIERLQELEALPPGEEMSEPPSATQPPSDKDAAAQAERAFRRMRATTEPLGLVLPPTY